MFEDANFLVSKVGFTYQDVKGMTLRERAIFQRLFIKEKQKEKEMMDEARKSSK